MPAIGLPSHLREQAHTLYLAGETIPQIVIATGVKYDTIAQWVVRYRWQAEKNKVSEQVAKIMSANVVKTLSQRAESTRTLLSRAVDAQAKVLEQAGVSSIDDLANADGRQGLAAVLKTVTESAAKIYAWDATDGKVGSLANGTDELQGIIDTEIVEPAAISDAPDN